MAPAAASGFASAATRARTRFWQARIRMPSYPETGSERVSSRRGRHHHPVAEDRLRVRRCTLRRPPRGHARLGTARKRRPPRRAELQVPPAARDLHCRQRRAQCARPTFPRRAHRAQRPCDDTRVIRRVGRHEPEPMAVACLRRRRDQRRAVALSARGLLLQDVHVAALAAGVAALRACDPRRGRHGSRGDGARPRSLRASIRPLRRADRRRRAGWTCRGARSSRNRRAGDSL